VDLSGSEWVRWQSVVNAVINFRIPYKMRETF